MSRLALLALAAALFCPAGAPALAQEPDRAEVVAYFESCFFPGGTGTLRKNPDGALSLRVLADPAIAAYVEQLVAYHHDELGGPRVVPSEGAADVTLVVDPEMVHRALVDFDSLFPQLSISRRQFETLLRSRPESSYDSIDIVQYGDTALISATIVMKQIDNPPRLRGTVMSKLGMLLYPKSGGAGTGGACPLMLNADDRIGRAVARLYNGPEIRAGMTPAEAGPVLEGYLAAE